MEKACRLLCRRFVCQKIHCVKTMSDYFNPQGISGIGNDIGWCGRHKGGKKCQLCRHYVSFETWSVSWHFYYLTSWGDYYMSFWRAYSGHKWHNSFHSRQYRLDVRPVKYQTTGLDQNSIRSLTRSGCKLGRKCKCISLIQRGHWFCPKCWEILQSLSSIRREHIHDLMVLPRNELKEDMLILMLSGQI